MKLIDDMNNLNDRLLAAPSYEDVLAMYELEPFVRGGDLQLTASGDIAVTKDGDLKWGGDNVNAMFRLIQRWRFNTPTLAALFIAVLDSKERQYALEKIKNNVAENVGLGLEKADSIHALNDEIGATEYGGAVYAGTIMVVLNNLLRRFQNDLNVKEVDYAKCAPIINDYSIAAIVGAAANNFRHHDE